MLDPEEAIDRLAAVMKAPVISLWLLLSQLALQPRSRAKESHRPELNASLSGLAYLPLALVMMLALELSRYSIYVLHAIGIVLLLSRVTLRLLLQLTRIVPVRDRKNAWPCEFYSWKRCCAFINRWSRIGSGAALPDSALTSWVRMNVVDPVNFLGLLDDRYIEIDDDGLLSAAHDTQDKGCASLAFISWWGTYGGT